MFHQNNIFRIVILSMITVFGLSSSAISAGLSSARAVGMGGAYTGLAKGVYAALYNPANLGLSGYRNVGIEIAGAGVEIRNNSFTLSDYNEYTGALLTEADKDNIIAKIPSDGLRISADAEASAMCLSLGSVVLSLNGMAATETNLGRDALDLLLNGNPYGRQFTLDGMYSEALAYGSAGLSWGFPLITNGSRQLAVGVTVKYIYGFGYEEVTEINGGVTTLMTGFEGEGEMIVRTATGGRGYGLDLGAALKLSDSYTIGAALHNLYSSVTWNKETEEHGYVFSFDSMNVDNIDDDSLVMSEDYSVPIDDFSTTIPSYLQAGFAKTSGKLLWAVDWIQGFELAAGTSSKPRLAFGAQYSLIGLLPLRAGYSTGGGKGSVISGGTGLNLGFFYIDVALSNHSGLDFEKSKGLHFAASTGLKL